MVSHVVLRFGETSVYIIERQSSKRSKIGFVFLPDYANSVLARLVCIGTENVPTKWQGNKFVCKATRLPRYYVRLNAENFISKRLKRYFLFDFNQKPIERSRGWFVIGGREKYDVHLNSWKAIGCQFFMHNETLFPRKCAKKGGEKSIGVQNLFPLLFSPLKRNAGILILTRHLVHAPLFTLHRVPSRIAR